MYPFYGGIGLPPAPGFGAAPAASCGSYLLGILHTPWWLLVSGVIGMVLGTGMILGGGLGGLEARRKQRQHR